MKDKVLELMQNAEENGSPVWKHDPEWVAGDIIECTSEFENKYDELVDVVKEIQREMSK